MPKISFHRMAARELNDAASYYEIESAGLGARFIDAVERCSAAIQAHPEAGANVDAKVQRRLIPGFPYALLYRVVPEGIRVLAVMNLKRRPMYWAKRDDD